MFIRNAWYIAAWQRELVDKPLARRICDEPIVLFRDATGKASALEDRCCHRGTPLRLGKIVATGLQCGYHGLVFDGTGRCVQVPGQTIIPEEVKVQSYPIVEQDEFVWIWMGEPARADKSLIVPFPYHNDSVNWPHKNEVYHIKANYMLMVDNLMDLTHLGYVHTTTIGGNPNSHVEAKMKITPKDQGLHFMRWMLDVIPPPTYTRTVDFKGRVDRWQEFEYTAPGSVRQWSGALDVGRGAQQNREQPGAFSIRLFHGLTPETEGSCFYFWSAANGSRPDDASATESLYRDSSTAFNEDRVVVEAQQAELERSGDRPLVNIVSDTARVHMRRTVNRMLAEEARHTATPN